jgi:hypothetical protein
MKSLIVAQHTVSLAYLRRCKLAGSTKDIKLISGSSLKKEVFRDRLNVA